MPLPMAIALSKRLSISWDWLPRAGFFRKDRDTVHGDDIVLGLDDEDLLW